MSEARHQHPVAAITQVLEIIRGNIIPILIFIFAGSSNSSFFEFFGILPVVVILLITGVLSWWRFTYQVTDGELQIKKGILVRKNIYLTSERIQVIDITTGIVQRVFGLVTVEVKTAGSSSKEAKIDAVTRLEAERIKDALRKNKTEEDTGEVKELADSRVYTLGMKDLVIAASTSGNLAVTLSIVGGIMSQLDQFLTDERLTQIMESIESASPGTGPIVIFVALGILVSWILSFMGTFIRYYGFKLQVRENELHIESGMLEQKQLTIPFNRIQAIRIKEELLRQPFGYSAVLLESAGYGQEQNNTATLFPLLPTKETMTFLQQVIPDYAVVVEGNSPPKRALRRYLLRMVWLSIAVVLPAWFMLPHGVYAWLIPGPALLLGYFQYRDALVGTKDKTMIIRSRLLSRTTAIVKKHRVQTAEISQNPFQKRLDLFSYSVTVASGSGGRSFSFREMDNELGSQCMDWASSDAESPAPDQTSQSGEDNTSS